MQYFQEKRDSNPAPPQSKGRPSTKCTDRTRLWQCYGLSGQALVEENSVHVLVGGVGAPSVEGHGPGSYLHFAIMRLSCCILNMHSGRDIL